MMQIAFPVTWLPSPFVSIFPRLCWNPLVVEKLSLSSSEYDILKVVEKKGLSVLTTKYSQEDKRGTYIDVLLKLLEQSNQNQTAPQPSFPPSLSLDTPEALQSLISNTFRVIKHYAITKLYEIVIATNKIVFQSEKFDIQPLWDILFVGDDSFCQRGVALCLAHIVLMDNDEDDCNSSEKTVDENDKQYKGSSFSWFEQSTRQLCSWISMQLFSCNDISISIVSPALLTLMNSPKTRITFVNVGGIGCISHFIQQQTHSKNPINTSSSPSSSPPPLPSGIQQQHLYELCYCLWIISFDCHISRVNNRFARDGAVPALVQLLELTPIREKVIRVALSTCWNLAHSSTKAPQNQKLFLPPRFQYDGSFFLKDMIRHGIDRPIDMLYARQWTDPDIVSNIEALHTLVYENYREMTDFDAYKVEVLSGDLEWNVRHTQSFFRQYARALEENDFFIIKALLSILEGKGSSPVASNNDNDNEEEVIAIACFDIGEFVRHYPNGRSVVTFMGGKDIIMKLLEHKNPEVQRQAILCLSKLLLKQHVLK